MTRTGRVSGAHRALAGPAPQRITVYMTHDSPLAGSFPNSGTKTAPRMIRPHDCVQAHGSTIGKTAKCGRASTRQLPFGGLPTIFIRNVTEGDA